MNTVYNGEMLTISKCKYSQESKQQRSLNDHIKQQSTIMLIQATERIAILGVWTGRQITSSNPGPAAELNTSVVCGWMTT